jgi:hypothetical protein
MTEMIDGYRAIERLGQAYEFIMAASKDVCLPTTVDTPYTVTPPLAFLLGALADATFNASELIEELIEGDHDAPPSPQAP